MGKYTIIIGALLAIFIFCLFGSIALDSYFMSQCKQTALKAGKPTDEIIKICGR